MPEVIDGVTYPTTPKGRPYPTPASPGKALWQLLERAMRELDDFETYELADLTAQVAALAAAVTATSPQRRAFKIAATQTINNQTENRLTWWASDNRRGDVAPSSGGIQLNATTGVITLTDAGTYLITLSSFFIQGTVSVTCRVGGQIKGRTPIVSGAWGRDMSFTVKVAANTPVEFWMWNQSGNARTFPEATLADGSETALDTTSYGYIRPTLDVIRLGA